MVANPLLTSEEEEEPRPISPAMSSSGDSLSGTTIANSIMSDGEQTNNNRIVNSNNTIKKSNGSMMRQYSEELLNLCKLETHTSESIAKTMQLIGSNNSLVDIDFQDPHPLMSKQTKVKLVYASPVVTRSPSHNPSPSSC
jgi:hypothetical protein